MRIVAGRWRGRRIAPPRDARVRPTADRVREAWMSILQTRIPDARVVDLFAGSGALGLEALSRGAAHADFVEIAPASLKAIAANIATFGAGELTTIHRVDAMRFVEALAEGSYDLAFADPPYGLGIAARLAELWLAKPFTDTIGIEHRVNEAMPPTGDTRRYGDTAVTFYSVQGG